MIFFFRVLKQIQVNCEKTTTRLCLKTNRPGGFTKSSFCRIREHQAGFKAAVTPENPTKRPKNKQTRTKKGGEKNEKKPPQNQKNRKTLKASPKGPRQHPNDPPPPEGRWSSSVQCEETPACHALKLQGYCCPGSEVRFFFFFFCFVFFTKKIIWYIGVISVWCFCLVRF